MSDDNIRDIRTAQGEELAFLILSLAATGSITATRRRYKANFDKEITGKHVQVVRFKYADKIRKKREWLLSDEGIRECPLLNRRFRVELLLDIIEQALEEKVIGTYKHKDEESGSEEVRPIFKTDLNSALIALKAIKDEDLGWEELQIKKQKGSPDPMEGNSYEVDDGVA